MPLCAADNCSNRFEDGFRLFLLPTDEHRKKQWLINMGRKNWTPSKITCLCEVHFDDSQWIENHAAGWKKLKPNAIPTLFSNPIHQVSIKTDIDTSDIFQICRICLRTNNDLINLFKSSSYIKPPYLELMEHTPLQVSSSDGLPPYICKDCFETLQEIKNFKEKCINSTNILKNYNGPNTIESLNEYIESKTQTEGIWYVDNEEDLGLITEDNQKYKENRQLIIKNESKLDEIIDLTALPDVIGRYHKKLVNEPYCVCHICGKKAKNIQSHLKTHNDSFDYKCDICGKKFRHNIMLRSHLVNHRKEKIFGRPKCSLCHKSFHSKAGLKRHIKNVHLNKRPFKCTLCPKSFSEVRILKIHMISHTGERRYKCDVEGCSRQYTQRTPLVQHKLKCHSNGVSEIKPFNCKICPKKFKQKRYLDEHLRFHAGVSCIKCNESFKSIKKFKIHMQEHISSEETQGVEVNKKIDSEFLESIDNLIQQELSYIQEGADQSFPETKV